MTAAPGALRPDYPQLDTMRAVASIAVVGTHTAFWAGFYNSGLLGALAQRLEVGVAVFFVLSGFLLGRPYLDAALGGTPHDSLGRYLRKRALRIVPVYWVVVIASFVLIRANHDLGPVRVLQNLLLVDLYRAQQLPQGLTQMWSLSVEVAFYLSLPLIGLLITRAVRGAVNRARRISMILGAGIVLDLAWITVTHAVDAPWGGWLARWLPAYLAWFMLGLVLALVDLQVRREAPVPKHLLTLGRDRVTCWSGALAVLVLISSPIGGSPLLGFPTVSEALIRHVGYAVVAFLAVLPCVVGPTDTATARIMSMPALRHVGHLSYSLFCCHMTVLYLAAPAFGFDLFRSSWPVVFFVVLALSLAVSEVLYRTVELPFLRLKNPRERRTANAVAPNETATHT